MREMFLKTQNNYRKDNLERDYAYWEHVIWSDGMKLEIFGHRDSRRKMGDQLNLKNIILTLKHDGGSIMLWVGFSALGTGKLVKVEGIIKKEG